MEQVTEAMDTNNNNNLGATSGEKPLDEDTTLNKDPSSGTASKKWEFSQTGFFTPTSAVRNSNAGSRSISKQTSVDSMLSNHTASKANAGIRQVSADPLAVGKASAQSGGKARSTGPSSHGLISPDYPSTLTSTSQLTSQLPSSSFSLEGLEFSSPMGSGTFSPLTSARLSRKRALSISPLSSSSLDLSFIRTSPNSLVNYITNSRGSSAGSIGHLSPSLFSTSNLTGNVFQAPHSRPPQFSLRNSSYPLSTNGAAAMNTDTSHSSGASQATDGIGLEKSEVAINGGQTQAVQIKKEMDTSPPDGDGGNTAFRPPPPLLHVHQNGHGSLNGMFHDTGSTMHDGNGANLKIEPRLSSQCSSYSFKNCGLETVHEEPIMGSSEDEGMHTDPTDYSSAAITENESGEFDSKLGILPMFGAEGDKQKRVYYSYPSVEEPHNNTCRWSNCLQQCESLEDLVRHVNSDHIYRDSRKDFVCYWSGCVREKKPFKAQYMLLVHMRRHTGEKPHRCTYEGCDKAYSRLENLKTHLRSHTGERPYMCKFEGCGKAFSNASDCAKHMNRTHSDEKPYACPNPGCTKRYTDPSSRRKHMKNCQVNKKARTDDRDAMSAADEESSAETASIKSSGSGSSNSKKTSKQKKSDKRKSNSTSNIPPAQMRSSNGGTLNMPPANQSIMGTADHGYVSGGSQGYMSGGSQGYVSSQTGYNSPSCDGFQGEEEITRILREQTLSDPSSDTSSPGTYIVGAKHPNSHMTDHMTPNVRASRQKGGSLLVPAGQNTIVNQLTKFPPKLSPQHQQYQLPSFPSCPSSQSGYSSLPSPHHQHVSALPSHSHSHVHSSMRQAHLLGNDSTPINAHGDANGGDFNGGFLAASVNGKQSRSASSGYSSFTSFSPPKAKSVSDDIDGSSVVSGSLRSSMLTNSYSTFSSNSSRVSSPCSNSGRSDTYRPHPPTSPGLFADPSQAQVSVDAAGYPLKHSLRMSNSYPPKQAYASSRRQSDDASSDTARSWNYSSQGSQYSYSGSELSDDLLENLPTDLSGRRESFSRTQPLPLPESMQTFTDTSGMEYRNGEQTPGGLNFNMQPGDNGGYDFMGHPDASPMQMGISGSDGSDTMQHISTLPLHHFENGASYNNCSQDPDGFETLFNGVRAMSPAPNMLVGDMASFTSTLPQETQYFESFLSGQVK